METKTEKMQELFTEEREGIHIRITGPEEWVNGLEDRMVEITAAEQNIEKGMRKKNEECVRDLWTILNTPTFAS